MFPSLLQFAMLLPRRSRHRRGHMNKLIALAALALVACEAEAVSERAGAAPQARSGQRQTAIFAGGCFWCTEADFEKVPGVLSAVSGYTGGRAAQPPHHQNPPAGPAP